MFRAYPRPDPKRELSTPGALMETRLLAMGAHFEEGSRPGTRSRISSIATFLGEKECVAADNHPVDKFSLKQLAKSYANRGILGRGDPKTSGTPLFTLNSRNLNSTKNSAFHFRGRKAESEEAYEDGVLLSMSKRTLLRNVEQPNKHESADMVPAFGKLALSSKQEEQENKNTSALPNLITCDEQLKQHSFHSSRTVVLSDFPPMTVDLTSILAQTCGGPIERISVSSKRSDKQGDWENKQLNLSFFKLSDAEKFKEFANTGMFLVNGLKIPVDFKSENETVSESIEGEMSTKGARRCLILKKSTKSTSKSLSHIANTRTVLADFDASEAKLDFKKFGQIVEIAAVISKRVSFAVHFYDTRSAINAKLELETPGTELNAKYTDWSVWYGKDPCDRPCYNL